MVGDWPRRRRLQYCQGGHTNLGQLSFKNAPNFEKPADANMDNVYMVTVVVTDSGADGKNKLTATARRGYRSNQPR